MGPIVLTKMKNRKVDGRLPKAEWKNYGRMLDRVAGSRIL
jgi:hypothetical protein